MATVIDALIGQQQLIAHIEKLRKLQTHAHTGPYRVESDNHHPVTCAVLWRDEPSNPNASGGRACFKGPREVCAGVCTMLNRAAIEVADDNLAEAEARLRAVLATAMIGGAV
jgi:hypothetical protein